MAFTARLDSVIVVAILFSFLFFFFIDVPVPRRLCIVDCMISRVKGCIQTTDKECRNGNVPMVIRSRDVIGPFS